MKKEQHVTPVTLEWSRWNDPVAEEREGQLTWEANQPNSNASNRTLYTCLRNEIRGPIGWTLQLGIGNPSREVSLVEVLALMPGIYWQELEEVAPQKVLIFEMVEAHLDVIEDATQWVRTYGLGAKKTASRDQIDLAARLLRDVARLRREAEHSYGGTLYEELIKERLEKIGEVK